MEKYKAPRIELIMFENSDFLCASGDNPYPEGSGDEASITRLREKPLEMVVGGKGEGDDKGSGEGESERDKKSHSDDITTPEI